ncbi:transketolase [Rhabdothermincola sediminis]|uniref:transketolase n=1 Tax=Rhabdothermincola sediminis TaxID=2751370 RepID=UPI001AA00DBA|nr:transketolase [Rhabdothermincola sediminis]
MTDAELQQRSINVIRGLAMDAPQAANSGHPGTAMALAPLAYTLWARVMRYDAAAPDWPNRDRFILSAGHASILLYSMLYLTGHGLQLDDIEAFRQWGSRTPGHPEVHHTPGVEVTTGPLGQGFANAVGMALAEHMLRARFGEQLFDHHTFVIASDGDLEEGISHEAASLAGHLGLGKLVVVYDDNHISIDGPTELAFSDDTAARFAAYGWHVDRIGEVANDVDTLEAALRRAMVVEDRPSLVILRSHIGYPSPTYTDTAHAHGSPLGEEEVRATKEILGLPPGERFWVPDDVLAHLRQAGRRGRTERESWEQTWSSWPEHREEIEACLQGRGLPGWEAKLPTWQPGEKVATRNAGKACIDAVLDVVPGLVGGGADLTGNTGTEMPPEAGTFSRTNRAGRQIHFGVREHGMGGIMNGMALHGGLIPVGGTFFVFSDYMRPSVRLAALSRAKVIYSWSHDSVGLGEDGPTHQPIEQLAAMRAMPGLRVIRPADANETAMAYRVAIESDGPTALILSRQNLPVLDGTAGNAGVAKGAYVLRDVDDPAVILIGTGSEVAVALAAADQLQAGGIATRVVSMPSWDLFAAQPVAYRQQVLPPGLPKVSVEAASTFGWERYADRSVGIDSFGASAPGPVVLEQLGITPEQVAAAARELLGRTDPVGEDQRAR